MQTFSGGEFYPLDPKHDEVRIEDIAHSLARQCRFAGHVTCSHYSVAEHSVRVSWFIPTLVEDPLAWRELALVGLLHDATEAYVVDVPRPLKQALGLLYSDIEGRVAQAVGRRFGVTLDPLPKQIKFADEVLLATEARDVMAAPPRDWFLVAEPIPERIEPWSPEKAEAMFVMRWLELGGRHLP